eukprot:TRINITY_DN3898_c1_g1_i1.p1 TRINITY_DN3898_c1_g1~~TRINITY_DN3898_c1_g1_i1.p1  ORF type:complete len:223 (+),score=31.79 TRINITY_DN3898_c1_g1_i1:34-669(+)
MKSGHGEQRQLIPMHDPTMPQEIVYHYPEDEDHYRAACVGTAICPLCGFCGVFMCCNSLPGKHGMTVGVQIAMVVGIILMAMIGILVDTKAVSCRKDMTGNNTDRSACDAIPLAYFNGTVCNFNGRCPDDYTYQGSERDGVAGWCKNDDHYSCFLLRSRSQPWITMVFYVCALILAAHFAKKYKEERQAVSGTEPVYGTPIQPGYVPGNFV